MFLKRGKFHAQCKYLTNSENKYFCCRTCKSRAPTNSNLNRRADATVSLDDLVEEDERVQDDEISGQLNSNNNNNNDEEEDELEAYMASIEQEHKQASKRVKVNPTDSESDTDNVGDDEEGSLAQTVNDKQDVEHLKADVEAAIAGINAPANKTINKLNQLSNRGVKYPPFEKNFYQEVQELAELTKEDVAELRMSLENIEVVGKSCPKPITCWPHCGLSKKVMEVLKKNNYLSPTPIQAQAIPAIMSGRDVIGIAKTGCGKTLSFLLPMFRHILAQPELKDGDGPIAIIITPTRELATQICDDAQKFTKILRLRVVAVYGGPNIKEQIRVLKSGAEIIVCTPGRMIEILGTNSGRVTNLNRCTYLVLDEADRLFDMGFEKQIRSIVQLIRPDRQTVMFSATFPLKLEAHARKYLTDPIAIQVGGRSIVCKDVHQTVEIIEEHDKFLRLLEIFRKHVDRDNSAIVFVAKQEKADSLLEDLMQAYDTNCLVLHGGIDKDDRMSTFASFKRGHARVLVATSVAARGLDVKNCICVVNYDCPNHYEDYVHRCGRTGRANNKGFAYTFITPDQGQQAPDIIKALELSGNPVPKDLQALWDAYKADAEKTGKKIWTSSGFSGRGFKFDQAEAQLVNDKKKYQKKSFGMQNSSDEEDEGGDGDNDADTTTLESDIKNLAGSKMKVAKPVVKVIGSGSSGAAKADSANTKRPAEVGSEPTTQNSNLKPIAGVAVSQTPSFNSQVMSKLDLVKHKAAMLCKKKGFEVTEPAAADSARQTAEQNAQEIRNRLGTSNRVDMSDLSETNATINPPTNDRPERPERPERPDRPQRLEMQFEINDYHQQVRRKLTSKDVLAKVSVSCGVGITVRGQFCAPGDQSKEPKLHLAIEGTVPESLEEAHRELLLEVKDEYERINSQPSARGRFKM